MPHDRTVIVLVGPTCVGKTGVSIALAEAMGTEIISADSMQVYRHMDIGTEKPAPEQLARVRHHMVGIVEPSESYSAGRYVEDVKPIIEALHRRSRVPVVTGGTGLYIRALTRGLFKAPPADWALREELRKEDPRALHARLKELDPETAAAVEPADARRTIRALEVIMTTGMRMSEARRKLTVALPYEFVKVGLWRDRAELYPMIERRVDEMMRRGLVEEVRGVLRMKPSRVPMQAIGYKEIKAHLQGNCGLQEAVRLIKRNTKRYAKRQFTWFGKEEGLCWVDITGLSDTEEMLGRLLPALPEKIRASLQFPH